MDDAIRGRTVGRNFSVVPVSFDSVVAGVFDCFPFSLITLNNYTIRTNMDGIHPSWLVPSLHSIPSGLYDSKRTGASILESKGIIFIQYTMESENIRAKCQYHLEELPPHPQDCHAIPQAPIHWQLYPKKNNKKKKNKKISRDQIAIRVWFSSSTMAFIFFSRDLISASRRLNSLLNSDSSIFFLFENHLLVISVYFASFRLAYNQYFPS